jgi:pimeloyl-ACP methyl ester carboxylesterase
MTERPLVVMLPALGLDVEMYAPFSAALADRADVLAIDYLELALRDSDLAAPGLVDRVERSLAGELARRDRHPTILGGVSLGGTLAYMLAKEFAPKALLLIAPGGLKVAKARRAAIEHASASKGVLEFARESLGLEREWGPAAVPRAEAYRALLFSALDVDIEERLRQNTVPTDLVWGAEDRVFSPRVMRRYADTLRGHDLHVIEGAGHFVPLDAPDDLARIVRERLAK